MSPDFRHTITRIDTTNTFSTGTVSYYDNQVHYATVRHIETKKERQKRIANEKMYASWKLYNLKTISIQEIKQLCKPMHRRFLSVSKRN